ncbi:neurochondrin [Salarias fasciatus]|uniref:Neurochondrin n=1 Tax=Salarias fasciatus TaxID=181472 RepID=A0A672HUP8_SALFA|nr:neurochondrin [Salarias fasciatus]
MADKAGDLPGKDAGGEERAERAEAGSGAGSEEAGRPPMTEAQRVVLERCIRALKEATKDSQTLAALLLITRLCPANDLDKDTLRRIFEAVGLSLPARLLVTAYRRSESSSLSPLDLLSLGTALLSALSTDSEMAEHPQLLTTVPILLGLVASGPMLEDPASGTEATSCGAASPGDAETGADGAAAASTASASKETRGGGGRLDEAMAADCYQVLMAVCASPRGPDHLLSRGAVPALCQAVERKQTLSREKGLRLLGGLLTGKTRERAWRKHTVELLGLLLRLCGDFAQASPDARLDSCSQLVRFLPTPVVAASSGELKEAVGRVWTALRPMVQSRLTAQMLGPVLVLSACLLDLYGWQPVGPPNFCCLLVNRACVEVRVGLEGPPGTELSSELQQTLAGCYRIMEAAFEQACCQRDAEPDAEPQSSGPSLSLQQSRQVFKVLEGGFAALMYYLQQVNAAQYDDPFVFATYRCVCLWLAEETSCLKEEVMALLPFLVGYARSHLQSAASGEQLAAWMELMSMDEDKDTWNGREALRYLLPALCHLSAEDKPRKVLLSLDVPALLVDFLSQSWSSLKEKSWAVPERNPSMESMCSTLLNFAVTEPDRVRSDPCFRVLEAHLSDALPQLVSKPGLLVLAANYCTLGLMMARLKTAPAGRIEAGQRRFFSMALRFLRTALDSSGAPGPVQVSATWKESWYEVAELWRLSLQALCACLREQPGLAALLREDGWLRHVLDTLQRCSALPDPQSQASLEEVLCAAARLCNVCREDVAEAVKSQTGALSSMSSLKKTLG